MYLRGVVQDPEPVHDLILQLMDVPQGSYSQEAAQPCLLSFCINQQAQLMCFLGHLGASSLY